MICQNMRSENSCCRKTLLTITISRALVLFPPYQTALKLLCVTGLCSPAAFATSSLARFSSSRRTISFRASSSPRWAYVFMVTPILEYNVIPQKLAIEKDPSNTEDLLCITPPATFQWMLYRCGNSEVFLPSAQHPSPKHPDIFLYCPYRFRRRLQTESPFFRSGHRTPERC